MSEKNLVLKLYVEIRSIENGSALIQMSHRNTPQELDEIRKHNAATNSDDCLELDLSHIGEKYAFKRYGNVDVDITVCTTHINEQIRQFSPKFGLFCYRIEHLGTYCYQLVVSNLPVVGSCAYTAFSPYSKGFLPNLISTPITLWACPDFDNMVEVAEEEEYDEELPNVDNDWDVDDDDNETGCENDNTEQE